MTGVSEKWATPTYACATRLLPLKRDMRLLVFYKRGLRGERGVSEGRWAPHYFYKCVTSLTHSNPPQSRQRWTPERGGTTIMTGQTGTHTNPTSKQMTTTKSSARAPPWRGTVPTTTTGRPSTCSQGGSCMLALDDDASTDINVPVPCLYFVTTNQHAQHPTWKPLLYSSEQLLNDWNVGAIKGVTSGI